jgi:hypothetical protein
MQIPLPGASAMIRSDEQTRRAERPDYPEILTFVIGVAAATFLAVAM